MTLGIRCAGFCSRSEGKAAASGQAGAPVEAHDRALVAEAHRDAARCKIIPDLAPPTTPKAVKSIPEGGGSPHHQNLGGPCPQVGAHISNPFAAVLLGGQLTGITFDSVVCGAAMPRDPPAGARAKAWLRERERMTLTICDACPGDG